MTLSSRENQVEGILSSILLLIMQEMCQIIDGDTNLLRQVFSEFFTFARDCRFEFKMMEEVEVSIINRL